MDYDFSQLNDKEFEILTVDLLSAIYETQIERFKPGRDEGVDGRFFSDNGKETIIQCKHYLKSGYKALKSIAKKEKGNLQKLNPKRYIFVTSLPLSRKNKNEISTLFSPYIKTPNDIFGQEDLNVILAENPNIEEKHFKLWIASTNVLTRILNNAIKGRSEEELNRIGRTSDRYVITRNHHAAFKILENNNVVIISGEPGIGKTTLAENLCLLLAANGYIFFDIEEELTEAEQVYKKGENQVFLFDDFLGSNYFEAIENKKDSHIMKFIERIKQDKSKKFILTSRTNILNTGIIHSNIFNDKKIRKNEFLLVIQNISFLEKARILYNHIWFSKLSIDYIREIYKDKRYYNIIKHKNFNPRLVEYITDFDRIEVPVNEYWEFIEKTLDNPKDIWSNSFKIQSNLFVRNLVMLTVFNGGRITENDLRESFNELMEIENVKNTTNTEKDFNITAQMAVKSFLNREKSYEGFVFSLFNPSITDFIVGEYCPNSAKLIAIYKSLHTLESLETLLSLGKNKLLSINDSNRILDELFIYSFEKKKNIDYRIAMSYLFSDDNEKIDQIQYFLALLVSSPQPITEISKFFDLLLNIGNQINISDFSFILKVIGNRSLEKNELRTIIGFLDYFRIDEMNILNAISEQIENYLESNIYQIINDDFNLSDYEVNTSLFEDDGEEIIDLDFNSFREKLLSHLEQIIGDIIGGFTYIGEKLTPSIYSVVEGIDNEAILKEYQDLIIAERQADNLNDYDEDRAYLELDIDDLFEQS